MSQRFSIDAAHRPADEPLVRRPVSEQDVELARQPTLASQLPLSIGEFTYTELRLHCACCGVPIDAPMLRARLSRPLPDTVEVEAVGVCSPCTLVTRFRMRLYPGRMMALDHRGRWKTYGARHRWPGADLAEHVVNRLRAWRRG